MKKLLVALALISLSGCASIGVGGWGAAHQAAITAVGAGVVTGENVAIDTITLYRDVKPVAPSVTMPSCPNCTVVAVPASAK